MERSLDRFVESLQTARERGRRCSLLVGAGCSVTAGIPTAQGFVDEIRRRYPEAFAAAEVKTYAKCMAQLSLSERRDLIAKYVDSAKINWAHICIAQLMRYGYVDRVLTTNFDPLVVRGCALLDLFPAVYDFAASQLYKSADVPQQAVIYLHGQRTGFVLLNTEEECANHSTLLAPVFDDAARGRIWLVAGYSGENDPVFDHLAGVERFDNNLYWVIYRNCEPPPHVRDRLLVRGKDAYWIGGYDADSFFVALTQKLGCFPPDFVGDPFTYLDRILGKISDYVLPDEGVEFRVIDRARALIQIAIQQSRSDATEPLSKLLEARKFFMAGDYERVLGLYPGDATKIPPGAVDYVAWAYAKQAKSLIKRAELTTSEGSGLLVRQAAERYRVALRVKPESYEILHDWGQALHVLAKTKMDAGTDGLFEQAREKYEQALKLQPGYEGALRDWGLALADQVKGRSLADAAELLARAGESLAAALKRKS